MLSGNPSTTDLIHQKINQIETISSLIPAPMIIHRIPEFKVLYISDAGLELLGVSREEVVGLSVEDYQTKFFNPEDTKNYVPKLIAMINNNTDEVVSYFHQVRTNKSKIWDWYLGLTRILLRDPTNNPLLSLTLAMRVDPGHFFTAKAHKLLNENDFLKTNYNRFVTLTIREREVLKLLALGKSAQEIALNLNISTGTVETHRKHIRSKLQADNHFILNNYARAFDLI